ncbi:MAG: hypothetical protein ACRDJX_10120 [Solirubrobacteraceae bacterium]
MRTSHLRRIGTVRRLTALTIAVSSTLLAIGVAAGSAAPARRGAVASHAIPRSLALAARRRKTADRLLVADAKRLKRCRATHSTRPSACGAAQAALQHAGSQLHKDELKLSQLAQSGSAKSTTDAKSAYWRGWSTTLQAPRLTASRETLHWTRVAGIDSYVLAVKAPGRATESSTVTGTSTTPPPLPGMSVSYAIRTAVSGSAWSSEVSISYPDPSETRPTETPPGERAPRETVDTQTAPQLSVFGTTLSWGAVGDVSTYVLATRAPGQDEQFTEVSGTSVTPSAVPGVTVGYSVRTAVDGSAWSPEVTISYPAQSTPPPSPPSAPPPPSEAEQPQSVSPLTGPMWVGVDAGGWPSSFAHDIAGAASYVRLEGPSSIAGWTAAGVKVIDDMAGPYNSGGVAAVNATEWAAEAVAEVRANPEIAAIEVLNEPGNKYIGWGSNAGDAANAAAYDHLLKVVHEAFVANFGSDYPPILASYDGGEGPTTWGQQMWAAEPNVGSYINGITLHSYGGTSSRTRSTLGDREQIELAHSQHPSIPIYITEVGWPTAVGQPATGDSLQWTEAEQAQNITNFIDWAKGTDYIADVTIFNYRDYGTNDFYGIETALGVHKLSYAALAAFK